MNSTWGEIGVLVNGSDATCPPDEFDLQSGGHTMTGYCLRVLALKIIQFFCRRFEQKKKKRLISKLFRKRGTF